MNAAAQPAAKRSWPKLVDPWRQFLALLALLCPFTAHAELHRAWVQHFDGGYPAGANSPMGIKLDSFGNIYVVGSAVNSSNLLDYVTLKYAPDGGLLWSARYGETNKLNNIPRSIGMDTNANLYVTGTTVTVKYSPSGEQLWTAPYGGRSLAIKGTNLCVAGYSDTEFVTAKISLDGTNLWTQTLRLPADADTAKAVAIGDDGSIYVGGQTSFVSYPPPTLPDLKLTLVKYDAQGSVLLTEENLTGPTVAKIYEIPGFDLTEGNRIVISFNELGGGNDAFVTLSLSSDATDQWTFRSGQLDSSERGMTLFGNSTLLCGALYYPGRDGFAPRDFGLMKLDETGHQVWIRAFTSDIRALGAANQVVCDTQGNSYVTGFVPSSETSTDLLMQEYDVNGILLNTDRYDGAVQGNDEGKAIAVDASGNVYVAGQSANAQGGTEIILIKYVPYIAVEKKQSSVILQFPGDPGQQYKVQATTNFPNWVDVGMGTASAAGLLKFEDTNLFPYRFYQSVRLP